MDDVLIAKSIAAGAVPAVISIVSATVRRPDSGTDVGLEREAGTIISVVPIDSARIAGHALWRDLAGRQPFSSVTA